MLVKEKKEKLLYQHQELILFIFLISKNYNIIQSDLKSIALTFKFKLFNYNENCFKQYNNSSFYNALINLENSNLIERNNISGSETSIQLNKGSVSFCYDYFHIDKVISIKKQNKRNTYRDLYNVSEKCTLILNNYKNYSINGFYDLKELLDSTSIFTKLFNLNDLYISLNNVYKFHNLEIQEEKKMFENELIYNKELLFKKNNDTLYFLLSNNIYITKFSKEEIVFYFSLNQAEKLCLDDIRRIVLNDVKKINNYYLNTFTGLNRNVKLSIYINVYNQYLKNISNSLNRKYKEINFILS